MKSDRRTRVGSLRWRLTTTRLVTLIGDVANAYVNLCTLPEPAFDSQPKHREAQEKSLQIAQTRFDAGETSELDPLQARTELSKTKSQAPELENGIVQAKNALAVLLGTTPAEIERCLSGPGTNSHAAVEDRCGHSSRPAASPAGRAAGRSAGGCAAQSPKVGVAVANMLPSFSLSGAFGSSGSDIASSSLSDLFTWQSKVVTAGGSFVVPILNYGRLTNYVRIRGRDVSASRPQLSEHRFEGAGGSGERTLGILQRAANDGALG